MPNLRRHEHNLKMSYTFYGAKYYTHFDKPLYYNSKI